MPHFYHAVIQVAVIAKKKDSRLQSAAKQSAVALGRLVRLIPDHKGTSLYAVIPTEAKRSGGTRLRGRSPANLGQTDQRPVSQMPLRCYHDRSESRLPEPRNPKPPKPQTPETREPPEPRPGSPHSKKQTPLAANRPTNPLPLSAHSTASRSDLKRQALLALVLAHPLNP
jgi:hypothetical protein